MSKPDYYDTLGISKSASKDEIKKAFRKAAVEHHPDKGGDEAKFKQINEAYEVLSDDKKKAAYDQFGHAAGAHQAGGGQGGFGGDPFAGFGGPGGFNVDFDFSGMGGQGSGINDIFEMFFQGARNRTRDVEITMTVDFDEAIHGATKELSLRIPNHKNNTRETKHIKVKIPAGIDSGQAIKLSGKGEINANGAAGDLYVRILVREDRRFRREGANIITEATIDMIDAALGTTLKVDTIDGRHEVRIPAGTQPGKLIKLSGRGAPVIGSTRHGDHIIIIHIEVPKKLTSKQKSLLEQYRENSKSKRHFWN